MAVWPAEHLRGRPCLRTAGACVVATADPAPTPAPRPAPAVAVVESDCACVAMISNGVGWPTCVWCSHSEGSARARVHVVRQPNQTLMGGVMGSSRALDAIVMFHMFLFHSIAPKHRLECSELADQHSHERSRRFHLKLQTHTNTHTCPCRDQ